MRLAIVDDPCGHHERMDVRLIADLDRARHVMRQMKEIDDKYGHFSGLSEIQPGEGSPYNVMVDMAKLIHNVAADARKELGE